MEDRERFESSISTLTNDEQQQQQSDPVFDDVCHVVDELLNQIDSQPSPNSSSTFISFVVDDIMGKIRSKSVIHQHSSSTDDASSPSLSSSIVDVPSAHSSRSISPSQNTTIYEVAGPIDRRILDDLELYSRNIAQEFVTCVEQLTVSLHNMSATSVCCLQTYRDTVCDRLNDTVETNIKTIYAFMAQAEQLSAQLAPIYELQKKIAYIKQLLDILSQSI